ncbi:MAG: protein kinase [Phycisphaerae bacterium]|nr:protein kinase [Phycisphaerae bacterium]
MASAPQDTFISTCPSCGKKYRIANRFLGKKVRCRDCGNVWFAQPSDEAGTGDTTDLGTGATAGSASGLSGEGSGPNHGSQDLSSTSISLNDDRSWVGHNLGRFQITDFLGKGAMGVVFCAHDPDLRRDVALKILARQFIRDQKRTYRLEQFVQEARSAARLSHPNSVTVFEIGQDKGWYFIAMELVQGGTLLDLVVKHKKRLHAEIACELIAQAADALSAAHKLGIVHRDIKPSNLMLTKDGRIKVADFGLAQITSGEKEFELPSKAVGTPYWMSPEQCKGQTAIPQSDVYSLGAVLYFSLTGEVPYKGKTKREIMLQHVNTPVGDPRKIRKDIPESVVRIIQRAMAKNPHERYQDAAEMGVGLRNIAGNLAQARLAERWWGSMIFSGSASLGTASKPKRSWSRVIAPLVLLVGLIGGLILWAGSGSADSQNEGQVVTVTATPTPAEPQVPVYINIQSPTRYHAAGCPVLKNVPKELIKEYPSDRAAQADDPPHIECSICKPLLEKQKENVRAGRPATQDAPAAE